MSIRNRVHLENIPWLVNIFYGRGEIHLEKLKLILRISIFILGLVSLIIIWNSAKSSNWDGVTNGLYFAFAAFILGAFNKFVLKD